MRPILAAFLFLPSLALAEEAATKLPDDPRLEGYTGISGVYIVEQAPARNSNFTAYVRIWEEDGRLEVHWQEGDSSMPGASVRQGRVVEIDWGYTGEAQTYLLMPDGNLHGLWSPDGSGLDRLSPR